MASATWLTKAEEVSYSSALFIRRRARTSRSKVPTVPQGADSKKRA